ncbi:MAG TPA: WYL domain-containing protein [Allosphingosinicella sp.]|nr:WYL domain-containing protein [Allosphingosinicella sp.]
MRASRLLAILILLQLRARLTASQLAEEFEVSERTIYRDIDQLSAAGIPVYGDRGPGGGFQLLDGYRTRLTGMSSDEAEAMLMIGLPGPATALGLGQAAQRAKNKLFAALAGPSLEGAGRIGARFHLDPVDWYRSEEAVPFLPRLARALLDQRVVEVRYESWKGVRDWRIEPLGLVLKAGSWYCVAAAGGRTSTFKVASMTACAVGDSRFERPADFDLAGHWSKSLQRFEAELRPRMAALRATQTGLVRLRGLGAYATRAAAAAGDPDPKGWAELALPIEGDAQAALALMAIGEEIEVLSPASLRAELRRLASRIAALHRD